MTRRRCRAPACGRFVTPTESYCADHVDPEQGEELTDVIRALRHVMAELREKNDFNLLVKYVPRVSAATIQAIRARYQVGVQDHSAIFDLIRDVSQELDPPANQ